MKTKALILLVSIFAIAKTTVADSFFTNPDIINATLSPDGNQVATIIYGNEHNDVAIIDTLNGNRNIIFSTKNVSDKASHLNAIKWIDNHNLALQLTEEVDGISNLLDTRTVKSLLVINTTLPTESTERIKKVRTKGHLVNALPSDQGNFIYGKQGSYSRLYKVSTSALGARNTKLGKLDKIDGGQFVKSNELLRIKGYVTRWFFTDKDTPAYALLYNSDGNLELASITENGEKGDLLKLWTKEELDFSEQDDSSAEVKKLLIPFSSSEEDNFFYSLDLNDEKGQKVYLVNYETNEEKVVYETAAYEIAGTIFSKSTNQLVGVRVLKNGRIDAIYFDNSAQDVADTTYTSLTLEISESGETELIYTEDFNQPGTFTAFNHTKSRRVFIGSHYPKLSSLSGQQETGVVDYDGLKIHYLLNSPPKSQKPAPLIVMPHGGPIGIFDDPSFDLTTQFFVSEGFAVLRVNFRGSGGFSDEFEEAGKLQWGDRMLEDIQKAAQEVSSQRLIDGERVCAFGASYGGYAALMLTIKYPDFYRCAVSISGLTDLTLRIENTAHSSKTQQWMKEQLLTTEEQETLDLSNLLPISPVYRVKDMQAPVLVMHGSDDEIVDIEHAHRLNLMLKKHQHDHQFKIYKGADHSLSKIEDFQDAMLTSLQFIRQNIRVN